MTRKRIEENDLSGGQYSVYKNIKFKTPMLTSDLCDYNDPYIVLKGIMTVEGTSDANKRNKNLTFRNNSPFRLCRSKTHNIFVDNAEDVDIVMPMYNLLDYSDNYSITSGSLWNYYRDEMNDAANETFANRRLNNSKTTTSKSFGYKTNMIKRTPADNNTLYTEAVIPLRYLIKFWRSLNLTLINCEVELDLS